MTEDGGLELLIETEARLAERLAAAEAEAHATLEEARRKVQQAEARYQAEFQAAGAGLTSRLAAEQAKEIVRLGNEAEQDARHFESLTPERIESLARRAADRVLDAWRGETAP